MNVAALVDALALPPDARVDQRVPKKLLLEQGAPTAADKRQITGGIEEMLWIAALKPTNIGVPEYRDAVRECLEIAVLTVALRPAAKPTRLVELIHRAIPYPVVLVAEHGGRALAYQEAQGAAIMQKAEILVRVDLARGSAQSTVWTCDFSYDYVKINADYRS